MENINYDLEKANQYLASQVAFYVNELAKLHSINASLVEELDKCKEDNARLEEKHKAQA